MSRTPATATVGENPVVQSVARAGGNPLERAGVKAAVVDLTPVTLTEPWPNLPEEVAMATAVMGRDSLAALRLLIVAGPRGLALKHPAVKVLEHRSVRPFHTSYIQSLQVACYYRRSDIRANVEEARELGHRP
jgi:hypothetical protein